MNQNKFTFESKNLTVDWIGFNIQGFVDVRPIAKYLFQNFGFNSTIAKRINGKWKSESLNYASQNRFQVSFRQHEYDPEAKSFWVGTKISFSGKNAAQIYSYIQRHEFDWTIFNPYKIKLGRFDLCYFRETKPTEQKGDLELFMEESCQKIRAKSKRRHPSWRRNSKGLLMKIGSRLSSNHYRVYEAPNGLRFELEMKKTIIQKFLLIDHIKDFEDKLTRHFYAYSKKVLVLDDCYTDWLIHYSRKTDKPMNSLVTSYLENRSFDSLAEQKQFFKLLQFLSFSRGKPFFLEYIRKQTYYVVEFKISEFMHFMKIDNKSYYQIKKVKEFLQSLQEETPFVKIFTEKSFRSVASFPYVELEIQHKSLVGRVAIAKELYLYDYPFSFPSSFLSYQTNYELQVKLQLIQVMSTNSLEKVFDVKPFLDQFNVSTQKKAYIKKLIIQSFDQLKEHNCIENQFQLITKSGITQKIDKLIPLKIGQSKTICFYEKL
jgi:hypothetical protein